MTEARPTPPLPTLIYRSTQDAADSLVAEALSEHPPLPGLSMRANAVRMIASMWYVHGSLDFPRGWVRSAMLAFVSRSVDCPNARSWRSYRSKVSENPGFFLSSPGAPVDLLRQMELDLLEV